MFDQVILRGTEGRLKGQAFVLENERRYVLGRSRDCSLTLPDPRLLISRYHCGVKVSAPFVAIQDLGSLNGTYVNGEKIGRRGPNQSFEEALQEKHTEYPLWDGDQLQIGDNVFQVEFDPPASCAAAEPRDQQKLWTCDCSSCC
ncbi:MAG TPA: FHA domain-containing protein [Gemmataceae bacterium]|jgi:pSer/pThr/pTyr-binding forkhead associated (FHA) protein